MDITQLDSGAVVTPAFLFNIQTGFVRGAKQIRQFGLNPDLDTGAGEFVWDAGIEPTYPTDNEALSMSSSDAGDTQLIRVTGLLNTAGVWSEQTLTVALTGQTPVALTDFIRVFEMKNGNGVKLAGDVYSYPTGSTVVTGVPSTLTDIRAKITLGREVSLMAMYTVPSGFTAFIYRVYGGVRKNEDAEFDFQIRLVDGVFTSIGAITLYQSSRQYEVGYEPIPEKSDMRAGVSTLTNNTQASASLHLIIIENKYISGIVSE